MAKTSESMLKAIQKYKNNLDEIRFSVRAGGKEQIKQIAKIKGHESIQAYMKHLIRQDADIEL